MNQVEGCSHDWKCTKCGKTLADVFVELIMMNESKVILKDMAHCNCWSKEELEERLTKLKDRMFGK